MPAKKATTRSATISLKETPKETPKKTPKELTATVTLKETKETPKETLKKAPKESTAQTAQSCCVCCHRVNASKEELLFCAGACQGWMHRYCTSVSATAYQVIRESASPFYCFACYQINLQEKLASLSRTVQELREEISELKTTTTRAQSSLRPSETRSEDAPPIGIMDLQSQSYASAASKGGESSINTTTTTSMNIMRASDSGKQLADPNKKFNVVIYGITECPSGTVRSERLTQDLAKVVAALSESGTPIEPNAIKDCFRLGKFKPQNPKPRPFLVKLIRVADVRKILSNRGQCRHPIFIKHDISPEERHRESILLKERWNLIQTGIPPEFN